MAFRFQAKSIRLRKWGSFVAIVLLNGALPLSFTTLGLMTIGTALIFAMSIFVVSAVLWMSKILVIRQKPLFGKKYRPLNQDNRQERHIKARIKALAKKANIRMPVVKVQLSKKSSKKLTRLNASSNSWPYANQISFSEDLLKTNSSNLSKEAFFAKMAHEISHIQHQDAFYDAIFQLFKITVSLSCFIVMGMILWLTITAAMGMVSFLLATSMLATIFLANEFLLSMWNRATETLADLNAVSLTKNPQAVVNFLYDKYYRLLYFGKLAYEAKNGGEKIWRFEDKKSVALLKQRHAAGQFVARKKIYHTLKKEAKAIKLQIQNQSQSVGWRYLMFTYRKAKIPHFISSWWCDYPRCDERAAVVISKFPQGF